MALEEGLDEVADDDVDKVDEVVARVEVEDDDEDDDGVLAEVELDVADVEVLLVVVSSSDEVLDPAPVDEPPVVEDPPVVESSDDDDDDDEEPPLLELPPEPKPPSPVSCRFLTKPSREPTTGASTLGAR